MLARWTSVVQDDAGNAVAGASIEVRSEDTGAIVMLYSNRAGTVSLGNPFNSPDGTFSFHVVGGSYRITARRGAFERVWRFVGVGTAQEIDADQIFDAANQVDFVAADIPSKVIPAQVQSFRTSGRGNSGDGGTALYRRKAAPEVDRPGDFLSNDGTVRWGIADRIIRVEMLGAVGDGVTDDAPAIQLAADLCAAVGAVLVLSCRRYAIGTTVDLSSVILTEAENATIVPIFDTGSAVKWVAASASQIIVMRRQVGMLRVEWPERDWTKERNSFEVMNAYNCEFHLSSVRSTRALVMTGNTRGCVYNEVYFSEMSNNLVGVHIRSETSVGWCNANTFHGGRFYGSGPVTGSLYEAIAGHIVIDSSPYSNNGNSFFENSIEWVGTGFRLARMGGSFNRLRPRYCELGSGDTTWIVDTGTRNLMDFRGAPYATGYDPRLAPAENRVDASAADDPIVLGDRQFHDMGIYGSQFWRSSSTTNPAGIFQNTTTGAALVAQNLASGANPALKVVGASGQEGVAIPAAGVWTVFNGSKRVSWSVAAIPTTGTWARGDLVFFNNPVAAGYVGAVCVTAGTPGTWKQFGLIEP